jgi:hypothetical protein
MSERDELKGALLRSLAADPAVTPSPELTRRVLEAAAPLLARNARRTAARRLLRALVVALLPFPLLLALDTYVLQLAYRMLSTVLPGALSLYLVGSYAAALALLLAVTYGAVPIVAARQGGFQTDVRHA